MGGTINPSTLNKVFSMRNCFANSIISKSIFILISLEAMKDQYKDKKICESSNLIYIDRLWHPPLVFKLPAYFVRSTATNNVEDLYQKCSGKSDDKSSREPVQQKCSCASSEQSNQELIQEMAVHLMQDHAEIVVGIHGYNTGKDGVKRWYADILNHANTDPAIGGKFLFIGYRWPSEQFLENPIGKLWQALQALPILLGVLFFGANLLAISALLFLNHSSTLFLALILLGTTGITAILTLILLRVLVYFRDAYRASNFGVMDLVELLRQLDQELYEKNKERFKKDPDRHRVRLNFICHSMGGFVTTNVMRILSNAFDSDAIGNLKGENKAPSPKIGRIYCLGRLVLVAPDIPVKTVLDSRANFLRSSLRRFEEAYLFSNEGDLALRIASTAANYLSYPARTRIHGYRLGNLGVRARQDQQGIVNWAELFQNQNGPLAKDLELSVLSHRQLLDDLHKSTEAYPIANLFTYVDCTDYRDWKVGDTPKKGTKPRRLLSLSRVHCSLMQFCLYSWQLIRWLILRNLDGHGGYFQGCYSSQLIYQFAFLSFGGFIEDYSSRPLDSEPSSPQSDAKFPTVETILDDLQSDPLFQAQLIDDPARLEVVKKRLHNLIQLSQNCQERGIQVLLSPERYEVDLLMRQDRAAYRQRVATQGQDCSNSVV